MKKKMKKKYTKEGEEDDGEHKKEVAFHQFKMN